MRKATMALALALAVLAAAPGARAQVPGLDLQFIPKIGAYLPVNDLGQLRAGAEEIAAEMEASLAVGLGLELDLPLSPLNVRANLDYATGSQISLEGIQGSDVDATVLALVGDLVFRPLPRLAVVQPYLLGGAGIKRYNFDTDDLGGGFGDFLSDDQNDFTVHLGAGLDVGLGPLAFMAEVSDYISWFAPNGGDSEMQNDIFGMVGVRVGML